MAGLTNIVPGMGALASRNAFNNNFALMPYFYNVEDYGAVHDGETDDTVAIQTAINAAYASGGGTIYFPNGVYLIAGALQTHIDFGDEYTNYNSQLYIPPPDIVTGAKSRVLLLGESHIRSTGNEVSGVIWKSTIAGSGTWPSVICSKRYNDGSGTLMNYNDTILKNISILVNPFIGTTGISMSGVNFMYASHPVVEDVSVAFYSTESTYWETLGNLVKPANHSFGIGIGMDANDFAEVRGCCCVSGFYYGYIFGEGVYCETIHSYHCFISLMPIVADYGCVIGHLVSNWNTNDIAGQQETVYKTPGVNTVMITYCSIENWFDPGGESWIGSRGPAWLEKENYILDNDNLLRGRMNYRIGGGTNMMPKLSGGTNLIVRNVFTGTGYHWTTLGRPTDPDQGMMGYNQNLYRYEYWTGTSWQQLALET